MPANCLPMQPLSPTQGPSAREQHVPSSSTASTVAPLLSRAWTTVASPFRAAMWSGLGGGGTGQVHAGAMMQQPGPGAAEPPSHSSARVGIRAGTESECSLNAPNKHTSFHHPLFSFPSHPGLTAPPAKPRFPPPPPCRPCQLSKYSHLQSTVTCIDKAKVLGFPQDQQGTLFMTLERRVNCL